MSSIKTNFEMPRGDDPVKQGQRLAQDLSANFKGIQRALDAINNQSSSPSYGLDGAEVSGSYSFSIPYSSGSAYQQITLDHGLGSTPRAFIVTDLTFVPSNADQSAPVITRTTWTTSQITIRIYSYDSLSTVGATSVSGTFKILVLR